MSSRTFDLIRAFRAHTFVVYVPNLRFLTCGEREWCSCRQRCRDSCPRLRGHRCHQKLIQDLANGTMNGVQRLYAQLSDYKRCGLRLATRRRRGPTRRAYYSFGMINARALALMPSKRLISRVYISIVYRFRSIPHLEHLK